ncbi:MAG: hypothetical protein L0K86_19395 [Actinomycetia bacterium]|nr:hypothetical protein [Actinomycetes bacterium]
MADEPERLWHVTVPVSGDEHDPDVVRGAMIRLGEQHAFLHSMRYAGDRAEVAYWEQAQEMLDAAAMALRVWNEHRASAGLPAWEVVGLEVLERETFQRRGQSERGPVVGLNRPEPTPFA